MHEIGRIQRQGQSYMALGATVNGAHVTGYVGNDLELKTWHGQTMLASRAEIVETYWHEWIGEPFAVLYGLTHGRFIVGYCLGHGMLFRGVLIEADDWDEARHAAKELSRHWADVDSEDEERQRIEDEASEQAEELVAWEQWD